MVHGLHVYITQVRVRPGRRKMQWVTTTVLLMLMYAAVTEGCGRRRSKPRPPSNRNPSITCPSVSDVTADSGSTSKAVYWSSPSVWDDHSGWSLRLVSGRRPGSVFPEGTHYITYKVTDRGGLSDACSVSFRVSVVRCRSLSRPTHGSISCTRDDNIYGRRCSFSCADGYWLDGSTSSVCQSNGYNSHSTPVCRKRQCEDFTLPANAIGKSCTDRRYYQSMCTIQCNTAGGYSPAGQNFAKCMADTQWSFGNWHCDDTEKPKILNCLVGEVRTSHLHYVWPLVSATDNSGSVKLSQERGLPPGAKLETGTHLVRYEAVDPSGNRAPSCVFTVTYQAPSCPPPKVPADDTEPRFECQDHKLGSHCQASCPLTRVVGSRYVTCRQTGGVVPTSEWVPVEGDFPTCYKTTCTDIPAPTNGVVACEKFYGGSMCQIHCNDDYDVPSSMKELTLLTCFKGEWTPVKHPPGCTEMSFPDTYYLPSRSYYFSGDCSDDGTHEQIQKAFIENFKRVMGSLCITETCQFENVEVTCGRVQEVDWGWDYPSRRRRDVDGVASLDHRPPVDLELFSVTEVEGYTTLPSTDGLSESITSEVEPDITTFPTFSPTPDEGGSGSIDGSGEQDIEKRFRTTIKFDFTIKNVSKVMSDAFVVDLFNQITNSTAVVLNGTDEVDFHTSTAGDVSFVCGPGKTLSNASTTLCVACPAGSFHNQSSAKCELCPLHSYSDQPGQTSCTSCDPLTGTERNGSTTPQQCTAMCSPGQFSKSGLVPCSPCQLGFYQSEHFMTSCSQCPADSSTVQFGASSLPECLPFDLAATGPVDLNFGSVIHDWVEELTVAFWVNILPPLDKMVNISLTFTHPTRGHQLTWFLKNRSDITMRDAPVNAQTHIRPNIWTHMALVWKGYPSFVDMYIGGKRVQHYGGHTPLCFLPQGTELTVHIGNNTGATIREVYVIPRSNTSDLIASLAKKCSAGDIGYQSLVTNIQPSNPAHTSTVVPSVCSEINRCDPDPCPGHHCTSLPHDFVCVCMGGYSGKDCSTPPDFCVVDNKCVNGATCTNTNTSINCTCTEDFKGRYCEEAIVHGNWGPWAAWSECSLTCGGGQRLRTRLCNNPAPEPELGKPCEGETAGMSVCNVETCPECLESQLMLGKGVSASCVEAEDGSMNCSVSCDEGLVFPGPEPSYTCRDEIWTPSNKTVSCVEFVIPETVELKYTVPYKTRLNSTKEDTKVIREKAITCATDTYCVAEEACMLEVTVETCVRGEDKCGELVEGYKAVITFTAHVSLIKDNLLMSQQKLKAAWESLNTTYEDLEAMYDECFLVQLSSGSLKPGTSLADSDLTCDAGTVPDQGYCSACEPGTRFSNQTCAACAKGWYQEDTGQMACSMCPAASNTVYQGSTLASECHAPPRDTFLLLTDPIVGRVWRANTSSFIPDSVTLPPGVKVQSAGYDPVSEQIIYVDRLTSGIQGTKGNHSETYVKLNWAASVDDFAVDPTSRLIFYADKGNDVIGVVTMETKYHKVVIRHETFLPKHIVLDPIRGILYWIDWGPYQLIERARYDGTERKVLVSSTNLWPQGLNLDSHDEKLYWTEGSGKSVQVMDVDGSNRRTVLTSDSHYPFSLTTFNGYIFYSLVTSNNSLIMRSNMDGSGIWKTELPPFNFISDMKVHRSNAIDSAGNGCVGSNGGCPFICFPRPRGQRECACPEGYTRQDNKRDCVKDEAQKTHWWDEWMQARHRRRRRRKAVSSRYH